LSVQEVEELKHIQAVPLMIPVYVPVLAVIASSELTAEQRHVRRKPDAKGKGAFIREYTMGSFKVTKPNMNEFELRGKDGPQVNMNTHSSRHESPQMLG